MKKLMRKQSLHELVQEEIKVYILENSLEPGDPLPPESELAQTLGVSRNSVREAVKSLESLGILEARVGAGLFVRQFSFDPLLDNLAYGLLFDLKELVDILEVRFHLEYGMVERAVEAVTQEQLEQLDNVLGQMRSKAEQGAYSAEDDRSFHQILWKNVDNAVLVKIIDIFWLVFRQAQKRASIPEPADPMATYQCHAEIVRALEQQDVAEMRVAMDQHYNGIEARVQEMQQAYEGPSQ